MKKMKCCEYGSRVPGILCLLTYLFYTEKIDRLEGKQADRKAGWLACWLVGWLTGWLVGWLPGWLVGC